MENYFYHDVYMNFKDKIPKEDIKKMYSQMENLKNKIPQITSVKIHNEPCNLEGKIYQGMFKVVFPDEKSEQEYQENPEHEKVSEFIQKISKEITVKNYLN
jgi:hypothetical protein